MGDSTTGTADDAAAARDSGTAFRSEQMTSKMAWLNVKRVPVEMSVADTSIEWAGTAVEVAERRAIEQDLVVQLRRELGTTPSSRRQLRPVSRTEGASNDVPLNVALQEALLVVGEQFVAVKSVRQRREAAAGHAGNHVDFIEQANLVSLGSDDLRAL